MDNWKQVWHSRIAPRIPITGLKSLQVALHNDSPQICQGESVQFDPDWHLVSSTDEVISWSDCEPGRTCPVAFGMWKGKNLKTCGEVFCHYFDVENQVGKPSFRVFTDWFDKNPREQVFKELLPEVEKAIRRKT